MNVQILAKTPQRAKKLTTPVNTGLWDWRFYRCDIRFSFAFI